MRVLFTTLAHRTHFYPLVPLAWAFRAAGHEVRIASEPALTDDITRTGLTAVPIEAPEWSVTDPCDLALLREFHEEGFVFVRDFDFAGADPARWTWPNLLALQHVMVPSHDAVMNNDGMLDQLTAFARHWRPDLVVWETYTIGGGVVARAAGAAHARFVAGPDVTMRVRREFRRLRDEQHPAHREDPAAEWLAWSLDRLGADGDFTEDLLTGQWTIDSTAPSVRLHPGHRTVGVRYVAHNGPAVVPGWLREPPARPRVCLTFGVSEWVADFLRGEVLTDLLAALADLDVEVVATVTDAQRATVTDVPANARLIDFVPLNDLLPTCAVVVHHGGIGTKANAELHGIPQVILGFGMDTEVMGAGLERLGTGLTMPMAELTGSALRERVARLLTEPSFRTAAGRLRDEMLAQPAPNDLVPVLERLTEENRGRYR
ncbi:activator-dependent family glycosyltransferase [Micromonospora aurantiaca (nom. illeg.)]|uniref:activator-dependent family glycosyltransferase n=1 Tax=Micromonospora aurantiaca (nom. illeg.) TaxID=47850 RepID=UPI003EBCC16A